MKRLLIIMQLCFFLLGGSVKCFALDPDNCGNPTGKFTDLAFISTTLKQENNPDLKSNYGFSFVKGNTYYLHKPIGGFLRFGIDAVWSDISYTNYKVNEISSKYNSIDSYNINQIDISAGVGASATFNFFHHLQASIYFRFNPTFEMFINDGKFQGGYASMFNTGVNVTYHRIGLGIEARFGKSKTKTYLDLSDMDYDEGFNLGGSNDKLATSLSGLRAYVCFRF